MSAREEILARLRAAPRGTAPARPTMPPLSELSLDRDRLIERFTSELNAQTGVVHQAAGREETLRVLTAIAAAEGIRKAVASGDDTVRALDLASWGRTAGVDVFTADDVPDREAFRQAAFSSDAGITSTDFAIAETGSLGLIFRSGQPRLASIAPPVHIAVVPAGRLYPVYENAVEQVFSQGLEAPSQFCFITGPSSTGDIQAVQFKGMHGPVKVIVIFVTGQD